MAVGVQSVDTAATVLYPFHPVPKLYLERARFGEMNAFCNPAPVTAREMSSLKYKKALE